MTISRLFLIFVAVFLSSPAAEFPGNAASFFQLFPKKSVPQSPIAVWPEPPLALPAPSQSPVLKKILDRLRLCSTSVLKCVSGVVHLQPPVGAVLMLQLYRLLRRRSILEDASRFFPQQWSRSRSLFLDTGDREYEISGGVHFVRSELYRKYFQAIADEYTQLLRSGSPNGSSNRAGVPMQAVSAYMQLLVESLMLSCSPGSRERFVASSSSQLDRLSSLRCLAVAALRSSSGSANLPEATEVLWCAAEALVELRAADALLRILRDKLLLSARILEQAEASVRAMVVTSARRIRFRRKLRSEALRRQRQQLAVASALLDQHLHRLGEVQKKLLMQPPALAASVLVHPSGPIACAEKAAHAASGEGDAALEGMEVDAEAWMQAAREWTHSARRLVAESVSEMMSSIMLELPSTNINQGATGGSVDPDGHIGHDARPESIYMASADVDRLAAWVVQGGAEGWQTAMKLVKGLPQAQRAQRRLLPHYASIYNRRYRGALSSLTQLLCAKVIHVAFKPHWPEIVQLGSTAGRMATETFDRRVYTPLREILLDLLNRQPRLIDAATLEDAETSLEVMLHDFAEGGSVPSDRRAALEMVSRAYENEIKGGILRNIFRGKLVRLMLIQVQVLKAELLKAMGAIDDLVDANRFNMQLFASVPALILFAFGCRLCFAPMYMMRTRARRVRSIRDVHAEMSAYLDKMERCLMLAGSPRPVQSKLLSPSISQSSSLPAMHADDKSPSISQSSSLPAMHADDKSAGASTAQRGPSIASSLLFWRRSAREESSATINAGSSPSLWTRFWRPKDMQHSSAEPPTTTSMFSSSANASSSLGSRVDGNESLASTAVWLSGVELGQFALHLHSYLFLLDFCSPPFSNRACDTIHHEVQDLLWQGQLTTVQQLALLGTIRARHVALAKSLTYLI